MFVARDAVLLEREYVSKRDNGIKLIVEETQKPQEGTASLIKTEQAQQIIEEPVQGTLTIHISDRVRNDPVRSGYLVTDDHDAVLIDDEPCSHQEALLGIKSHKWLDPRSQKYSPCTTFKFRT